MEATWGAGGGGGEAGLAAEESLLQQCGHYAAARHVVGVLSPCLWPLRSWAHGSQLPRSVLSRERLLVFRGEMGLGGLLRLELLEAVECLGESESSPS